MWDPFVDESEFPELPPLSRKVFVRFVNCANRSWNRYYEFVRFCHAHRVRVSDCTLHSLLARGGFSDAKIGALVAAYLHGRKVLSTSCPRIVNGVVY